jgi:hypothetical protein
MGGAIGPGGERSLFLPAALTAEPISRPMPALIFDLSILMH